MKLLCSSNTLEKTEKLINDYFYSSSYKLIPINTIKGEVYEIIGKNKLENFIVKKEKGRYKFYELLNQLN
jgi:hypothetical protein